MSNENKEVVSLFDVNRLLYLPSTDASPVINRSVRRQYPQKNSYVQGDIIVFELHGSHFADFSQSTFSFNVAGTAGSPLNFGSRGSVLNLFKEIRVIAPNGREISRLFKSNLLHYHLLYSKHGSSFKSLFQNYLQFGTNASFSSRHFTIPMRLLESFFESRQLVPPRLVEGLRIEITLEQAIIAGTGGTTNYSLTNPMFNIDSYELNNQANIILAQMSPLVYEYKTWKHTESSMDGATNNADVVNSHSVSSALEAVLFPRSLATINNSGGDSFSYNGGSGAISDGDTFIWRWGSVQMPQNVVDKVSDWFSTYVYTNGQMNSHSLDDWNVGQGDFTINIASPSVQLRRSNVLDKSGREISNQNELQCSVKFNSLTTPRILDMYVNCLSRLILEGDTIRIEQ